MTTPKEVFQMLTHPTTNFGNLALAAVPGNLDDKFYDGLMTVVYEEVKVVPECMCRSLQDDRRWYTVKPAGEAVKLPVMEDFYYSDAIRKVAKSIGRRDEQESRHKGLLLLILKCWKSLIIIVRQLLMEEEKHWGCLTRKHSKRQVFPPPKTADASPPVPPAAQTTSDKR